MITPELSFAALHPLLASGAPKWVWATLAMAGFVGLTVVTMALARIPTRQAPPPLPSTPEDGEDGPDDEAATSSSGPPSGGAPG